MVYYFLFITLKTVSALLFHFKGFKRHFAALRELVNSWFRFLMSRTGYITHKNKINY